MNRVIKFRAWDKEEKVMIEADNFAFIDIDNPQRICDLFEEIQEDFVLMQYTGFKDTKGNEIYDGDILKFYDSGEYYMGKVYFSEEHGGWNLELQHDKFAELYSFYDQDDSEVIGNIYENPKLMEKNNV